MTPKLSKEVTDALHTRGDVPLPVVDPTTNKVYLLVDQDLPVEAIQALQRQHDLAAIQRGHDQAEAGLGIPFEEAYERGRERLIARTENK